MKFSEFLIESHLQNINISEASFCMGGETFKMRLVDNTTIASILKFLRSKIYNVCNMYIHDFKVENDNAIIYIKCVMNSSQYDVSKVLNGLRENAVKCGIKLKSIG